MKALLLREYFNKVIIIKRSEEHISRISGAMWTSWGLSTLKSHQADRACKTLGAGCSNQD
jgi:hypothetical protein